MKFLMAIALALTVGCGTKRPGVQESCTDGPQQDIDYPNGERRLSNIRTCTMASGAVCNYATWVSDSRVTYTHCEERH